MDFAAGATAVKASLELGKVLTDKLNRPDIDVADVRAKLHEMLIHMVYAQMALADARVENAELRQQLDVREELRTLADDMDFMVEGGFFIRKSEVAKGLIAYCPMCWTDKQKVVPMQGLRFLGAFRCNIHKNIFRTKAALHAESQEAKTNQLRIHPASTQWSLRMKVYTEQLWTRTSNPTDRCPNQAASGIIKR